MKHLVLRAGSDRFRLVVSAVVMAFPPPPEFVICSFTPRYYATSVGETPVEELEDRWKELIRRRTNLRRRRKRISNRLRTLIACSLPSRRYLQPDVRELEFVRSELNFRTKILRQSFRPDFQFIALPTHHNHALFRAEFGFRNYAQYVGIPRE